MLPIVRPAKTVDVVVVAVFVVVDEVVVIAVDVAFAVEFAFADATGQVDAHPYAKTSALYELFHVFARTGNGSMLSNRRGRCIQRV